MTLDMYYKQIIPMLTRDVDATEQWGTLLGIQPQVGSFLISITGMQP